MDTSLSEYKEKHFGYRAIGHTKTGAKAAAADEEEAGFLWVLFLTMKIGLLIVRTSLKKQKRSIHRMLRLCGFFRLSRLMAS